MKISRREALGTMAVAAAGLWVAPSTGGAEEPAKAAPFEENEKAGLDPHLSRIRLVQVCKGDMVYVFDVDRLQGIEGLKPDYAAAAGAADPAAESRAMVTTYRAFQRENLNRLIRPYEGMRAALEALRARGLTLGVVTSKVEWAARECYEYYGLGEFLSIGVFHDDTERHKPDPQPLLYAAAKGGLDAARTVYVSDSMHDMAAGRAAGMRTIAALWGPFDREDLVQAGADELAERPEDLLTVIGPRAAGAGT